ncbi:MAG: methyltransferase domain-containing protein [Bacteroidia bacterium]|nr:methyltransferase domain-containing protein [Bacteroidia bacterium]
MEKYIWDFLESKDYLSGLRVEKPGKSILDLGCRHGNSLFHAYHRFGFEHCEGVDLGSLGFALSDAFFFNKYHNSLTESVVDLMDKNDDPEQRLLAYYRLVANEKLTVEPLSGREAFWKQFRITYNKSVEDRLSEERGKNSFDLVLLAKVLHFHSLENPGQVVREAMAFVKEGGVLFIKTWVRNYPDGRRRDVDMEDINDWIKDFKLIELIKEGELAYIFLKK